MKNIVKNYEIVNAFETGRHRRVLEIASLPGRTAGETMALIGSLAFLGRIEEALELWSLKRRELPPPLRARARFTIGLALTRVTRFREAREFLNENLRDRECESCADVYQGAGGFYYYLGKFQKAARFAKKALRVSLENEDQYIRLFATDLLGHVLCETGRLSAGLRLLRQAQEMQRGHGIADFVSTEYLYYEAQSGLRPESMVEELRRALESAGDELSYIRANLLLELARQLTLRGRWAEARSMLDQEAVSIYSHENRRQEVTLQLRLAEIAYRQGDGPGASHFLRAARRRINKIGDRIFEVRILGLEQKVERRCFEREPSVESSKRLSELSREVPHPVNTRIQKRLVKAERKKLRALSPGEDPLGDLLDLVARDSRRGAEELLKAGYLGLWPEALGLRPGVEKLFVFESGHWIVVRKAGVFRGSQPLSQTSRRMLFALSRGQVGKGELLREVWGYEYDPLRHDPMIYAALAALRKALGSCADWISTHDMGWSLGPAEIPSFAPPMSDASGAQRNEREEYEKKKIKPGPWLQSEAQDLNWRQIKAIMNPPPGAFWTAPLYRSSFGVSLMTAWRDLDSLVRKRYLLRVGHGRLTRYLPREV